MKQSSRRQFLKGSITSLGAVLMTRLFPEAAPVLARTTNDTVDIPQVADPDSTGESFAGLLLLPEGAPVPSFVRESKFGVPVVCGIGANKGGAVATAITQSFDRVEDLKEVVAFPIYTLGPTRDLRSLGATMLAHETGEIFAISVDYQTYNEEASTWETTVSIWAYPDFPRPFPLWQAEPVEPGAPAITLEKVDFLPAPGIMVATAAGYVCHWVDGEILYHLVVENHMARSNVQLLAGTLTIF